LLTLAHSHPQATASHHLAGALTCTHTHTYTHTSPAGTSALGPSSPQQLLGVQEAVELLHYCTSDLVVLARAPREEPAAPARDDASAAGGRTRRGGLPGGGGDGGMSGGDGSSLMGIDAHGLLAELSAGTTQVGQLFNSALNNLTELVGTVRGSGSGADGGATTGGGGGAEARGLAAAEAAAVREEGGLRAQVDYVRLGELRGLPVPTAAGSIVALGECVAHAPFPGCVCAPG